jgi:protein-L-isoaspartate(D-aspartate) O-methyltransferase
MKKQELIEDLKERGVSENILQAFKNTKRELFISKELQTLAYEDTPLPIGNKQTISQPYTIAFMLSLLDVKDKQKILEIGSGSGYVLALLNHLNPNGKIYGIERIQEIAEKSKKTLSSLNYKNIQIFNKDGSKGLEEKAPLDRILVSAAYNRMPKELTKQLKINGILVTPVKNSIYKITKRKIKNKVEEYYGFAFVPIIPK